MSFQRLIIAAFMVVLSVTTVEGGEIAKSGSARSPSTATSRNDTALAELISKLEGKLNALSLIQQALAELMANEPDGQDKNWDQWSDDVARLYAALFQAEEDVASTEDELRLLLDSIEAETSGKRTDTASPSDREIEEIEEFIFLEILDVYLFSIDLDGDDNEDDDEESDDEEEEFFQMLDVLLR